MAYGGLGLRPWEFARFTPWQFHVAVKGAEERDMVREDLLARLAVAQLRAWGARVNERDLLGRPTIAETKALQRVTERARD